MVIDETTNLFATISISTPLTSYKNVIKTVTLFKKPQNEHSPPLFKRARILPIEELYQLRILLIAHNQFYKYVKKSTPKYYTRQSEHDLPLPPSTSASGHRQVLYQASEFCNRLPKNISGKEKINCFKTKVKEHLLASL